MSGLRQFFAFARHSIPEASLLLIVTSLLSNVLGLARNLIFYRLIAPGQLDIYNASFKLSDLLYNLLIFGAISSALVPVVSNLIHKKQEENARRLINQLITWSLLSFTVLGIVLGIFMPQVAHLIVPHFDTDRINTFVALSRIMLLQPLIFAVSFIVGSLLNGYRRFAAYSLAPVVYNAAIIVGGILAPHFGIKIITEAVIVGAILHMAIQYREAYIIGYRLRFDFGLSKDTKEVIRLMLPRSLAQGFATLVPTVYTNLASGLIPGSISVFTGINDIQTTPTVVIANSLATATFPSLTALAQDDDLTGMNRILDKLFRTTLFALLPIVAMGLVLRAQLVRLYIGIGQYSWILTDQGIALFAWFLIGIIPASFIMLLSRVFYAHKDSRTPLIISFVGNSLAILTAILAIRYAHGTVAQFGEAETFSSILQCLLYFILLHQRGYAKLSLAKIGPRILIYLIGTALLLWTSWASLQAVAAFYLKIGHPYTTKVLGLFVQTVIAALIGGITYFGYSTLTSKEEMRWLRKRSFSNGK